MAKKHTLLIGAAAVLALTITGCTGGTTSPETPAPSSSGGTSTGEVAGDVVLLGQSVPANEITGEITVITNRTDLVDTKFVEYGKAFEAKYPGTSVKFEALTNLDQDMITRLAGGAPADVFTLPNGLTPEQLTEYLEPLAPAEELAKEYRFASEYIVDGETYAISVGGVASGLVINKQVFADAGIDAPPTTPEGFLEALAAVKEKTDAVPYYTNYADMWPIGFFDNERAMMGDPNILEVFPEKTELWVPGEYTYITDKLLFDIVNQGLSEEDPLTTNWEKSKTDIASGKIASMLLGSWAVPQMQDAAESVGAERDVIGFWPFPYQVDGKFHSKISGDRVSGISKDSKNKATARAWLDFFLNESGFAQDEGMIPVPLDSAFPASIEEFAATGVELVELNPAIANAGKENEIWREAELDGQIYRQQFVDVARGAASGDWDSFTADLNSRWKAAQAKVMGE